jgi:hypothetical protein
MACETCALNKESACCGQKKPKRFLDPRHMLYAAALASIVLVMADQCSGNRSQKQSKTLVAPQP